MVRRGFTLIELLVIMAIISALAAIAIPTYYSLQLRSKKAEAKTMFASIRNSQIAFRSTYDGFANVNNMNPATVPGLTPVDWPNVACPAACSRTNLPACDRFSCIGFSVAGTVRFSMVSPRLLPGATAEEFAIGMLADLDGVDLQSSFSYQSGNTPGLLVSSFSDGISSCPVGIPVEDLIDCTPYAY